MRSNQSVINVYKKKSMKSEVVTQLLYGETFKKLKQYGTWIKIKNDSDNYKGFIKLSERRPVKDFGDGNSAISIAKTLSNYYRENKID